MFKLLDLLTNLPSLVGQFFTYLNKRADIGLATHTVDVQADAEVIKAQLAAWVEVQKVAAAAAAADRGWWVTAWMKPAAFYTSLCHYVAVVFDSLPWFGHQVGTWGIPVLPGQYALMERDIILFCVGIVGLKGVARIFTAGK